MLGQLKPPDDGALILVVDDDPVLRLVTCETLRREGYRIEEAGDGAVAVERFRETMPALVLMDVQMPVMDGIAACEEIRRVSDFAANPILMLTSLNDRESIDRAFEAGATDFIPKPVNPRLLLGRVRFALRARQMAADLQRSQTELRKSEESRDFLLRYDLVTGLPNEELFMDRLRQAVLHADQDGTSVAVLVVGMENCAVIANSMGAEVCDRLVKMLAERLAGCILEADTVARLSFGHFGMILSYVETPEKAAVTAAKAIEVMMQEFEVEGRQLFLDAHAGISMYPLDGSDAEAVFNNGNTALERAREACLQHKKWQAAGFEVPHIAVNLSALDFQDPDFPQLVGTLLVDTGMAPGILEVELTESVIMTDADEALEILNALKEMGIRLALDDFGTGYSSLAYLQKLPVDALKIDRSFVTDMSRNPGNAAIVRSTIELAHGLGLEVVAEGVEDQEALEMLEQMGCEAVQGFFIGRPMAGDDTLHWLNAGPRLVGLV